MNKALNSQKKERNTRIRERLPLSVGDAFFMSLIDFFIQRESIRSQKLILFGNHICLGESKHRLRSPSKRMR